MIKKKYLHTFNIIILTLSIISLIYICIQNSNEKYNLLFLLPFTFIFLDVIYLNKIIYKRNIIFRLVYFVVEFLRCCVSPSLMVYNNEFDSIVSRYIPTNQDVTLAIICICIELIVSTTILYIWDHSKNKVNKSFNFRNIELPNKIDFYVFFIIVSLLLSIVFPEAYKQFHFFIFSGDELNILKGDSSVFLEITIMCLIVSKSLIYILFMSHLNIKYKKSKLKRYIYVSFLITVFNASIYNGGNRSQFIFTVIASVIIFLSFYPSYTKQVIYPSMLLVILVISFIYDSRNYYDYYASLKGVTYVTHTIQSNLDAYFGGVNLTAVGIATKSFMGQNATFFNFLYDCIRPIVGVNILVRGFNMHWSNVFYNAVAGQGKRSALIFPAVAQGFFYFDIFGCFIIPSVLLIAALSLEKMMNKENRIEIVYIFILVLIRMGTLSGINITIAFNEISFQLLLFTLVYLLNNKISFKRGLL